MNEGTKNAKKLSSMKIATLETGTGPAIQANLSPTLRKMGIHVEIFEAKNFDEFSTMLSSLTVDAAVIPITEVEKIASQGLLQDLTEHLPYFRSRGTLLYTSGETVLGTHLSGLQSILTIPPGMPQEVMVDVLLPVLATAGAMYSGRGVTVAPQDKNTFEWEIHGPDKIPESQWSKCVSQTYQVRYKAENAKLLHIIWNKKPPAGTSSVERSAMDNEGDHPDGKRPSTANLDSGTWNVPYCSKGTYTMTVTVIWLCTLDNIKHTETKSKTIEAIEGEIEEGK